MSSENLTIFSIIESLESNMETSEERRLLGIEGVLNPLAERTESGNFFSGVCNRKWVKRLFIGSLVGAFLGTIAVLITLLQLSGSEYFSLILIKTSSNYAPIKSFRHILY